MLSSVLDKYVRAKECKHLKHVKNGGSRKSSGYESNQTCNADLTVLKIILNLTLSLSIGN